MSVAMPKTIRNIQPFLILCCLITVLISAPSAAATSHDDVKKQVPESETIQNLRHRADAGEAVAQTLMGMAYESGLGLPQDTQRAIDWYKKAKSHGLEGDIALDKSAALSVGDGVKQNIQKSKEEWRKASDLSDSGRVAQERLSALVAPK